MEQLSVPPQIVPLSMSRPKRRKGRPEALVASALKLFRETGYGGSTVRDIAQGAGMTVAALYHHFGSKQDVLFHIMHKAMTENLSSVRQAADAYPGDPQHQLQAMAAAVIRYHIRHQSEAFVGSSELRSLEPAGRAVIVALRDEEEQLFRAVIQDGVRQGVFASSRPVLTARAVLAMCSAVASWYTPGGPLGAEELIQSYAALSLQTAGSAPPQNA